MLAKFWFGVPPEVPAEAAELLFATAAAAAAAPLLKRLRIFA